MARERAGVPVFRMESPRSEAKPGLRCRPDRRGVIFQAARVTRKIAAYLHLVDKVTAKVEFG